MLEAVGQAAAHDRSDAGLSEEQLQRREYNRRKQQRHVDNRKMEASRLKRQIRELEDRLRNLAPLVSTTSAPTAPSTKTQEVSSSSLRLLSWLDVEAGLREDCMTAVDTNRELRRRHKAFLRVIVAMTKWVESAQQHHSPLHTSPRAPHLVSLNHVRLVAHDVDSRRHGFDWITQILYHNTAAAFDAYSFPTAVSYDMHADYSMDFTDGLRYVWRLQVDVPTSVEVATEAMQEHFFRPLRGTRKEPRSRSDHVDTELLAPFNMTYVRKTHRGPSDDPDDVMYQNLLYRVFNHDRGRVVVVGQTIPDDDTCPRNPFDHKSILWIAIEHHGADVTRIRILRTGSHMYAGNDTSTVSLDREAALFGFDISACATDEEKQIALARHFHPVGVAATEVYKGYLRNALASIYGHAPVRPVNQTTVELVYQQPSVATPMKDLPTFQWTICKRQGPPS